ncbi:sensitivity to high expression protein she9 [Parahypoxylon ruwenzoriense]
MSTTRAFKPLFGPSYRLLVDQLVPPQTITGSGRCRLILSQPLSTPLCPSCLHRSVSSSRHPNARHSNRYHQQLQFSSRSTSSSSSKPPITSDNESHNATVDAATAADAAEYHSPSTPPAPSPSYPSSHPPPSSPSNPDPEQPSAPNQYDQQDVHPELPSAQNSRRSQLNRSLSNFMDRAQTTFFAASQRINDLTGYSGIETLKSRVSSLEAALSAAQHTLLGARSSYKSAVSSRSATQREVTTLLARQKSWTPPDFERFTGLYRQDYELEAAVTQRASELEDAEREAERLSRDLSAAILSRYHEEQIWSDKIRRMSTWGTWGLMGVNVLLFLVFQFGAEPWRRRRLVRGFEEKVREALEEERERDRALGFSVARPAGEEAEVVATPTTTSGAETSAAAAPTETYSGEAEEGATTTETEIPEEAETVAPPAEAWEPPRIPSWREALSHPDRLKAISHPDWWKAVFADLSSERRVAIRMRDVSLIALEGAAAGAAVVGTVAIFFIRRT